ncbi:hypothetical protein LZ31DRAFT_450902, partial [Colletotrichum somersetense]
RDDFRFQSSAILTLQEAAKSHLTAMFKAIQLAAIYTKRITIMKKDINCIKSI